MATTLKEATFSGNSNFKIRLSYDLSQSQANNTSTIKYYLYVISMNGYSGSGATAKGYINGSQVGTFTSIGVNVTKQIGTKTVTVTHDPDGRKSVSYSASVDTTWSLGDASLSGTLTLPTIKRQATITSAPNFTDEQNPTITYSNPAGNSVSSLQVCIASTDGTTLYTDYRDVSKTGTSYTFNLTETERYNLRYASRNSNTLAVRFFIRTIISGTTLRNSVQKTLTIVNANPTESSTFEETNQKVINLLGDSTADTIIQNISNISITASVQAQKEATIKNVQFINGSVTNTINTTPYTTTITPETNTFTIKTTDSRNNVITNSYTKTLIEYVPVDISSFSFKRVNPTSSNILLNAEIRYKQTTFGSTVNVPTIKWKKGESGTPVTLSASDYTIDTTNNIITISNLTLTDAIPYTDSETFYLYVEDLLSNDTENTLVAKGIPTFEAGEHDFQVNGDLYVADQNRNNPMNILDALQIYWNGVLTNISELQIELKNFDITTGTSLTTKSFTYSRAFSERPFVFIGVRGSVGYVTRYGARDVTTTGFSAHVAHNTANSTVYYWYLAIGKK